MFIGTMVNQSALRQEGHVSVRLRGGHRNIALLAEGGHPSSRFL